MPIYGDSLIEATRAFQHQINALLTKTITQTPIRPWFVQTTVDNEPKQVAVFGFQRPEGRTGSAEIRTQFGVMDLYVGITCDLVDEPLLGTFRLRTIA